MTQKVVTLRYHDIDRHSVGCQCGDCNSNGKSYGYAIMDLTSFSVTHEFLITEEITDALANQDPENVVYGPSEEAAKDRALAEISKNGWKLPEKGVTRDQLIGALQMLIGEDGQHENDCYCHEGLTQNFTMCAYCWARAAYQAAKNNPE